jgi:predicted Zn-dependent protease with MMP-like domain
MRFSQGIIAQHLSSAAMESIDFQPTSFFKEMVLLVSELQNVKSAEVQDSEILGKISNLIKHYTGISVTFDIADHQPHVNVPPVNRNNVLVNSFIRNFVSSSVGIRMISQADHAVRGAVNLKESKVTGIFTEVDSVIGLPLYFFTTKKFSAEEISGVIFHEIGHLFTYFEFMTRSVSTNQILAGLAKSLDDSGTVEEREAVLISVKQALKLKDLNEKELAKSTDKRVAEVVVITNVVKQTESELGSNIYDFSTWEMLSDQFAARHGAHRHVVTALSKIYQGGWNISFRSLPAYLAMEAAKLVLLILAPHLSILLMSMDGSGDGTYDRPGARFKRLRNQVVENLKDKKLKAEDHERLTADLKTIDDVLAGVEDRRQLVEVIWNAVIPYSRKAWNQERLQRELENLAVNELFVKSAELRQMV